MHQIAPQSIHISKNFLGALGSAPYAASHFAPDGLRPPKELPQRFSGSAPGYAHGQFSKVMMTSRQMT